MIEVGFELDKTIAKLLGWSWDEQSIYNERYQSRYARFVKRGDLLREVIPYYSDDMGAAWEVLEHCKLFGWFDCLIQIEDGLYTFADISRMDKPPICDPIYYEIAANTVPLAICKAALKIEEDHKKFMDKRRWLMITAQ